MYRTDAFPGAPDDSDRLAAMFKALGDPTRLRIFQFLQSCCGSVALAPDGTARPHTGATVGDVCCCLTGGRRVTSTLSFHLRRLEEAGLVRVVRRGRHRLCSVNAYAIQALLRLLEPPGDRARTATMEDPS